MPRAMISIIELQIAKNEKEARKRISNSTNQNISSITEYEKIRKNTKKSYKYRKSITKLIDIYKV